VLQYSRQIENLRRTRDLLLPRLMSGQISLDDAVAEADAARLREDQLVERRDFSDNIAHRS
jgi:hypothetical protein